MMASFVALKTASMSSRWLRSSRAMAACWASRAVRRRHQRRASTPGQGRTHTASTAQPIGGRPCCRGGGCLRARASMASRVASGRASRAFCTMLASTGEGEAMARVVGDQGRGVAIRRLSRSCRAMTAVAMARLRMVASAWPSLTWRRAAGPFSANRKWIPCWTWSCMSRS